MPALSLLVPWYLLTGFGFARGHWLWCHRWSILFNGVLAGVGFVIEARHQVRVFGSFLNVVFGLWEERNGLLI